MDLNDTGNRVIVGVVAVLLIIGAWYLGTASKGMVSGGKTSDSSTETFQDSTGTWSGAAPLNVSGENLSVQDQPAGSYVMVTSATLPQVGWVAIRDSNGRILGAGRLDGGVHGAVQVPLLRNTESGQKYQALVYTDDGDKAFDLHKDTLLMNSDGSVAGTTFSATNGD